MHNMTQMGINMQNSMPMMQPAFGMMQQMPQNPQMGSMNMPIGLPAPPMPQMGVKNTRPQDDENTLYVGGLNPSTVTDERLFSIFSNFGHVTSSRILKNSYNGDSRGFGFVTFQNKQNAQQAKQVMHNTVVDSQTLVVNWKKNNPKNLPAEANLYVKNLDERVTSANLEECFREAGEPASVTVRRDPKTNQSLKYGYVQFKSIAEAVNAIEKCNGARLYDKNIQVEVFQPRSKRPDTKNNLYVKDFPKDVSNEQQVRELIEKYFGVFGQILSVGVKFNEKFGQFCAFVAFKNPADCENALKELSANTVMDTKLYVTHALTKQQREELFSKNSTLINKTNFIVKSLKLDVTAEDLRAAFSKFGEVTSTKIQSHQFNAKNPSEKPSMNFGFVSFKEKEHAEACFKAAKSDEGISKLISEHHRKNTEFLCYHQTKMVRGRYNKVSHKNNKSSINYYAQFMKMMNNFQRSMYRNGNGGNNFNNKGQRPNPQQADLMMKMFMSNPMMQMQNPMMQMPNPMMQQQQMMQQQMMQQQMMQQQMMPGAMMPGPMMGGQMRMPPNMNMQPAMIPQQPIQQIAAPKDSLWLQNNIEEFKKMNSSEQKTLLGTLMFNQVKKYANEDLVPKITGMLIDLEVLEIQEIAEILNDDEVLKERIDEATKIIEEDGEAN